MTKHPDILIVGGGVIGLTTAYYLSREGVRVTVLDRGEPGQQASWAGAGILPPADLDHARTPFDRLRALSVSLFPQLSRELHEQTGMDNGYFVCGGLELLIQEHRDSPQVSSLPEDDEWHGGVPSYEHLDRARLLQHIPGIGPAVTGAYHLPTLAQVRNPRHMRALLGGCVHNGVQVVPHCSAHSLVTRKQRILAIETDQGKFTAGQYLLTAGAWSDPLLGQVGWQPNIKPIRGQIALLNTGKMGVRPVLLAGRRYLVPRADGRLLIGSTEEDAGFDARPTAGGVAELLAFAAELLPALAEVPLEQCWAGLRPGSPDGLPYLGVVPGWENLYVACGHYRAGIQLSPGTGRVMMQTLLDRPCEVDLSDFSLSRTHPDQPDR